MSYVAFNVMTCVVCWMFFVVFDVMTYVVVETLGSLVVTQFILAKSVVGIKFNAPPPHCSCSCWCVVISFSGKSYLFMVV